MNNMDNLTINTLRFLAAEAIQKAKSGHPGLPLGAAPAAYTLWAKELKANPANPNWDDRDRFILSAGHGLRSPLPMRFLLKHLMWMYCSLP